MAEGYIVVDGLAEFRRALRSAIGKAPRQLTAALKKGAEPILAEASRQAPNRSGTLAKGYKASVRGATGNIVSRVPYAGGAEWGRHGKWSGFSGAPPRFVWPAVESEAEEAMNLIAEGLRDVLTVEGWFSGF